MTHTPGPWHVGRALNGCPTIEAEQDKRLAVAIVGMHRASPEAHANALLIAAAPLMLDVLKETELVLAEKLRRLGADPTVSPTIHRVRAAIQIAKGVTDE